MRIDRRVAKGLVDAWMWEEKRSGSDWSPERMQEVYDMVHCCIQGMQNRWDAMRAIIRHEKRKLPHGEATMFADLLLHIMEELDGGKRQ